MSQTLTPTSQGRPAEPEARPEVAALPKGLKVLVVEDEPVVGRIVKSMLERLGCRVWLAEDALDALTGFASEPCEVVLTDVVMPAMTGFDLVECLKSSTPHLIHLYMSGYPSVSTSPSLADVARPLIRKPFTQAQLERALITVYNDPDCQAIFGSR